MRQVSLAALLALTLASPATAAPILWSENGHYYEAIHMPQGISWDAANTAAIASGGYLATIHSAAENEFVFGLIADPIYWRPHLMNSYLGPWLGGYQSANAATPNTSWNWVTDEPWDWTNWCASEPNDGDGEENRLCYFSGYDFEAGSWWGDDRDSTYLKFGYVIEYSEAPEPATLSVILIGAAVVLRRRRGAGSHRA